MVDIHQSQIRFYRLMCFALLALYAGQIIISSANRGPFVITEESTFSSVSQSKPWKLSVERVEGFLRLYLSQRMEWSKVDFDQKRTLLLELSSDGVQRKLKDSLNTYGSMAKAQDMRCFFVLEGFRFSNEKQVIEAEVSRVIRIGAAGVVTPMKIAIGFSESPLTKANPYGMTVISLEESDLKPAQATPPSQVSESS